jgi:uncharacterized membrane protein required for colicin V production
VLVLAVLAHFTRLPHQPFWRHAVLRPYVEFGVRKFMVLIPTSTQRRLPDSLSSRLAPEHKTRALRLHRQSI